MSSDVDSNFLYLPWSLKPLLFGPCLGEIPDAMLCMWTFRGPQTYEGVKPCTMYEVKSWDSILVKGKVYYGILELLLKLCRKFCVCI